MNGVFGVGGGERVAKLHHVGLEILPRKNATLLITPHVGQLLPLHKLHGQERVLTRQIHQVVDADDIGVAELAALLHLTLHIIERGFVHGHLRRKAFEGKLLIKLRVHGQIHHTHAAPAKLLDDFIAPATPRLTDSRILLLHGGLGSLIDGGGYV